MQNYRRQVSTRLFFATVVGLTFLFGSTHLAGNLHAQIAEAENAVTHKHLQSVSHETLTGVCSTRISSDQQFLYAAAWDASSIVIYKRDQKTGLLEYVESLTDEIKLQGCTSMDISPDGKLAIATAFQSDSVCLMKRDVDTGKLEIIDSKSEGDEVIGGEVKGREGTVVAGLGFTIDAMFSNDGRYAYFANENDGIAVFEITDKPELNFVQHFLGKDGTTTATREVAIHPTLQCIYAASQDSSTITVLDRNPMSGELTPSQVIVDGENGVTGMEGAFGLACSRDGKYLFATSGRFSGDSSVICFKIDGGGKLTLVNEIINDETDGFSGFLGGNNITASDDGKSVYATGTRSGVLAAFSRNAESGKITFQEFLKDDIDASDLGMAAGVSVSKDGKFVYVGSEENGQVIVFKRETN